MNSFNKYLLTLNAISDSPPGVEDKMLSRQMSSLFQWVPAGRNTGDFPDCQVLKGLALH